MTNPSTDKPHKGRILRWWKHHILDCPGLGFVIRGDAPDHPQFSNASWFHTSWVEKYEEQPDGTVEVETRNSRYTLTGPPRAITPPPIPA